MRGNRTPLLHPTGLVALVFAAVAAAIDAGDLTVGSCSLGDGVGSGGELANGALLAHALGHLLVSRHSGLLHPNFEGPEAVLGGFRRSGRRSACGWPYPAACARFKSGGNASAANALSALSSGSTVCPSLPSRRIDTERVSASFLPTTRRAGTFISECSRTL